MIKKSILAVVAVAALMSGTVFAQFISIAPSDLGLGAGTGPLNNAIFDISSLMGEADGSVTLEIDNGFVSGSTDAWTVGEGTTTRFTLGGTADVNAFVNHGANLGSDAFQNGSMSRDGITSAAGETWTFVSTLDASRYTAGQSGNDYFIDYTGVETNQLEANSEGFRWTSDQAVSVFEVFSFNTVDLNNNYTIGFETIAVIPEPASATLIAFASLILVRRKRS